MEIYDIIVLYNIAAEKIYMYIFSNFLHAPELVSIRAIIDSIMIELRGVVWEEFATTGILSSNTI